MLPLDIEKDRVEYVEDALRGFERFLKKYFGEFVRHEPPDIIDVETLELKADVDDVVVVTDQNGVPLAVYQFV
jgi:hypothetical protein